MSVKVNSTLSDVTFTSLDVPNVSGLNNNVMINTSSTRTYLGSIGVFLNEAISVTISATKTIPAVSFVTTLLAGITGNLTIGGTTATGINILSSSSTTAGQLKIQGADQNLKANGVAGYNTPLLSDSGARKSIQTGKVTGVSATGTTVTFPVAFSAGATPTIVCCCSNAVPSLIVTYQPSTVATHIGFGVAVQGGGKDVNWIALSS